MLCCLLGIVVHRYKKKYDKGKSLDLNSKADSPLIGHYSRPKLIFLVVLDLKRFSNALSAGVQFFFESIINGQCYLFMCIFANYVVSN